MNLKGKVAVVTGATGGIGKEIVKGLDNEGVKLILVSKRQDELETLKKNLINRDCSIFASDFSDQHNVLETAKEIARKYQKIDILINAVGIGIYKSLEEASLDEWNKSMDINVNSIFIITKELIFALSNADNSVVVNLGSGMGVSGKSGRSLYCASKFALRGLTLSLADEYKRLRKPEFVLLTLGSVLTSFGPMSFEEKKKNMEGGKGYLTPEWVARKIIDLLKLEERKKEYEFSSPDYNNV